VWREPESCWIAQLIHGFINMTTVPAARDAALRLAGMVRASLALAK
jgi:hypothetical protein